MRQVGIDVIPESLTWPAGNRPEWLRSKRWHVEVAASTGFDGPRGGRDLAIKQIRS